MHLRPYLDEDFDALVTAWRAASVVAHPFLTPDFLDAEVISIRDVYLPASETWVAVEGEEVIGFLALLGSEVGALFVHPKFWSHGIGRALLDKAVELRGALTVDVFEANEIGRAFYERHGFTATSEEKHEETGLPMVHMQLPAKAESSAAEGDRETPNQEQA
jgi:putative acetyltransferase